MPREPHQISIKGKAPEQPYCFLIRSFDAQFDAVETAVTDAARLRSLLVATSKNIQDELKWIQNVEYGILAARLVVAICSPHRTPTRSARQAPFNKINESLLQNSMSATQFAFIRRCERPRLRPARAETA